MVALSLLLPLLLDNEEDIDLLLSTLTTFGISTDAELLFTSRSLPPELEALRPKIQTFLAAEGRPADEVYKDVSKEQRKLTVFTGCESMDVKLLDGGFKNGDVVEIVGNSETSKTFLALQTVLRHLSTHPSAYALWLDTTGTFSADWAMQILGGLPDSLKRTGQSCLPPLDRLIVAKTFDLASAIQAIQSVRKDGFPRQRQGSRSESEMKEAKPAVQGQDTGDDPMQVDVAVAAQIPAKQPETAVEGDHTKSEESKAVKTVKQQQEEEEQEMRLTFIVIDSITILFRNILSGVTTEGHAKMVSFMRLLRSLSYSLSLITLLTNSTTASQFPSGLSVFNSLALVKPSLGPTFSYLCDWTLWIGAVEEAFERERSGEGGMTMIMEVWRSRRALPNRWMSYKTDGTRFLD